MTEVIYRKGYDPDMVLNLKEMVPFKIARELRAGGEVEFWVTNIYEENGAVIFQCPENF